MGENAFDQSWAGMLKVFVNHLDCKKPEIPGVTKNKGDRTETGKDSRNSTLYGISRMFPLILKKKDGTDSDWNCGNRGRSLILPHTHAVLCYKSSSP